MAAEIKEVRPRGWRVGEDAKSYNQGEHHLLEMLLLLKFPQVLREMEHAKFELETPLNM